MTTTPDPPEDRPSGDALAAANIRHAAASGDLEIAHMDADEILCSLLRGLGYTETVDAFERLTKWYTYG